MHHDLVLTNGRFTTNDPAQPAPGMVAIRDGVFSAVGSAEDGNVTQVTMDLVDQMLGDPATGPGSARIAKMWPPIVAFAVGATAAGFSCLAMGFASLLLPAAALLILWWRLRMARRPA